MIRQAISVPRANLISLGICLGKFSKTEKFRLHVTGLDILGRYAKHKVRIVVAANFGLFGGALEGEEECRGVCRSSGSSDYAQK